MSRVKSENLSPATGANEYIRSATYEEMLEFEMYFSMPMTSSEKNKPATKYNIIEAIMNDDLQGFAKALENHKDEINTPGRLEFTPLHVAANDSKLPFVKALVENNASIFVTTPMGNTPLHHAILGNSKGVVEYLVECGAPLDTKNVSGVSLLMMAFISRNEEMFVLLEEKLNNNFQKELGLLNQNILNLKQQLDEQNLDSDSKLIAVEYDDNGFAPIHKAIIDHDLSLLKKLMKEGADLSTKTVNEGATPLHLALLSRQAEMIKYLLQNNAPLHIKDSREKTAEALAYFLYSEDKEIIELLKEKISQQKQFFSQENTNSNQLTEHSLHFGDQAGHESREEGSHNTLLIGDELKTDN